MENIFQRGISYFLRRVPLKNIIIKGIHSHWNSASRKYSSQRKQAIKNKENPRIVFGPVPILNIKFWSDALRAIGLDSSTLMTNYFSINKKEDFDAYFKEILDSHLPSVPKFIKAIFRDYVILDYILKNKDIVVVPFTGFTNNKLDESFLYKKFGIKSVIIPYGADFWIYSNVNDSSYKYGLMANYPLAGWHEPQIRERVEYWNKNGDCVVIGPLIDGASRWDSFPYSLLAMNLEQWKPRKEHRDSNGVNATVKIAHSPNHRYVKGTEFLLEAVKKLQAEGIKVELIILERIPNEEVKRILCEEADILVEKLTYCVYGLSAAEGMAAGLPVISNLENESITRAFRRYSFLDECPLVSATPENVYENLKFLIANPEYRRMVGGKGREFMEKYHSYKMFGCFFKQIISLHWFGEETDLVNYFHPLNPESYNSQSEKIIHPLIENRIPDELLKRSNHVFEQNKLS